MGTRGAWGFVIGGEEKLVYNNFDSYPAWLGRALVEKVGELGLEKVREGAERLRPVSGKPTARDLRRFAGLWDKTVSDDDGWYSLLREAQGDLERTLEAGVFEDASEFPLDSLFCEWAYVIDFDSGCFEVYVGFQKTAPERGRWKGRGPDEHGYCPVELAWSCSLDALPTPDLFVAQASQAAEALTEGTGDE